MYLQATMQCRCFDRCHDGLRLGFVEKSRPVSHAALGIRGAETFDFQLADTEQNPVAAGCCRELSISAEDDHSEYLAGCG